MKRFAILLLLLFALSAKAQTVSNLGGVGSLQFFNDDGTVLTTGMVYIFQAQTSTPVAVYVDSSGTTQQPNPVPLGGNGRTQIWLASGTFVKIQLCSSNTDGAFCSAGHILFSADNILVGSSGGGGGGTCSTGCIGFFISSTASPATSGVLRLSSADSVCWRNQAGSANLCLSKDSTDIFSFPSPIKMPAIAAPSGGVGFGHLWFDNSANRWKVINNGGIAAQLVISGSDISTSDSVTAVHFGASAAPFSSTLPSTNQALAWNGTNIAGTTLPEMAISWGINTVGVSNGASTCASSGVSLSGVCVIAVLAKAHTLTRINYVLGIAPAGCTTPLAVGVRDNTSATVLSSVTVSNGQTTGFVDSGALSVATTAGDQIGVGITTSPAGCTTTPQLASLTAVFQ